MEQRGEEEGKGLCDVAPGTRLKGPLKLKSWPVMKDSSTNILSLYSASKHNIHDIFVV